MALITALCHQKGGAGKTCLSVSLAVEWMLRGYRTAVVDVDDQGTTLEWRNLANYLGQRTPQVIAMGEGFADLIPQLASSFDRLIIDSPGRQAHELYGCLAVADFFLMPTVPGYPDMWTTAKIYKLALRAKEARPDMKIFAVINKLQRNRNLSKSLRPWLEEREIPVLSSEVRLLADFDECIGSGQGVTSYAPKSEAAKDLRALADEIDELAKEYQHAV